MPFGTINVDSVVNSDGITSGGAYGLKNRIINGAVVIDQRNAGASVSVSTSVNTFPVDRMALLTSGATATAQRVAGTGAYTHDVLYTGAASVTASFFFQRIESVNCLDLVNETITFQVQLSSTTVTSVAVGLFSAGSTDNFSAPVSISTTTFTITSTPTIYTLTVGAGANAANGLQIQLNFGAFTSGTARVSGLQLEKGSTATSFDYRPFGTELALCQRYYQRLTPSGGSTVFSVGIQKSTTSSSMVVATPVVFRATPTCTQSGIIITDNATFSSSISSVDSVERAGSNIGLQITNSSGGGAQFRPCQLRGDAANFMDFSAEL